MNQEETIALLKGMQNKKVDYAEMVCAPAFAYGYEYVYLEPEDYAIEEAVKSLKEIQNYRKLGTLEELARAKKYIDLAKKHGTIGEMIDECAAYEEIGTVEECRKAVEKQKPKKPHRNYKKFSGLWCKCGWYLGQKQCLDIKYCPNCGQAIDENLEGMEE